MGDESQGIDSANLRALRFNSIDERAARALRSREPIKGEVYCSDLSRVLFYL